MHPYGWSFEPLFLVLAAAAAVAYARDARRARPSRLRIVTFSAGVLLVAACVNSPLEHLAAHYLLLMHLLQNALLADWAPVLLILGLTPEQRARVRGRAGSWFETLTRPRVALPLWLAGWYGVHIPAFYDWALRAGWPLNLEHAILFAVGFCFFWPLFEAEPRRLGTAAALAYLGIAFVASPWLALAYIFSSSAFYSFYEHAPRIWGLSAAKDQNLGGIVMQTEQTIVFLGAIAFFLLRLLDEEHAAGA